MNTVTLKKLYKLKKYIHKLKFSPAYSSHSAMKKEKSHAITSGSSTVFDEHRLYQPGDTLKTISWSVSARKGTLWTKHFNEEKNNTVTLLLDLSAGMFFSSHTFFKAVIALEAVALLGWKAIDEGNKVACIVMTEQDNYLFQSVEGNDHFCHLLQCLTHLYQQSLMQPVKRSNHTAWFGKGLYQLKSLCCKQESIVLISDFIHMNHYAFLHLEALCKKHQVTALRVSDPLELGTFPQGFSPVSDGQECYMLSCHNQSSQRQFKQACLQYFEQIKKCFTNYGVSFTDLTTHTAAHRQFNYFKQEYQHVE